MDPTDRAELNARLELLADWLYLGCRRERPEPEFQMPADPEIASRKRTGPEWLDVPFYPETLDNIQNEVRRCAKCRLAQNRLNTVFGEGVLTPTVLVVGEGPGQEEDKQGKPFVGPAGKLLDKMLAAVNLDRGRNCYITNIVKCRPPMNRDPAPDERETCLPYLERQIRFLRPRVILALGRTAAQSLLKTERGVGVLRGVFHDRRGLPLLVTYHPSAILRDDTLKRPAWEDLKRLRAFLDDGTAK